MSTNRPIVLILASDPAFAREITAHWPQDHSPHPQSPEFIVLDEGFSSDLQGSHYDLAIADASSVEDIKNHKRKAPNQRLQQDLKQSFAAAGNGL